MSIFHRYNSTIHGNYRRAYLRGGLLSGALMGLYVLVRLLMGSPMESPTSLIVDVILLVILFLLTAWYRNSLPEKKITLKEAMLFGIGTAAVAALLYGLLLWTICLSFPQQTELFTNTMNPDDPLSTLRSPLSYWAAWWAILATMETLLLGAFGAFVAAVCFRNERPEVHNKKK